MAYSIELTISGLCLLVPDYATSPSRTVVLMPKTPDSGSSEHKAAVIHRNLDHPLGKNHQLEFRNVPKTDAAFSFQRGIVNLSSTCSIFVDRADLLGSPKHIAYRALLEAGGIKTIGQTLHWKFCGKSGIEMTDEVLWRVDGLTEDQLTPGVFTFDGKTKVGDLDLEPDDDNVLRLRLDHHSDEGPMGKPQCPHRAEHYAFFYNMLRGGSGLAVPELEDCPKQEPQGEPLGFVAHAKHYSSRAVSPEKESDFFSPTVFTCMVSGATP